MESQFICSFSEPIHILNEKKTMSTFFRMKVLSKISSQVPPLCPPHVSRIRKLDPLKVPFKDRFAVQIMASIKQKDAGQMEESEDAWKVIPGGAQNKNDFCQKIEWKPGGWQRNRGLSTDVRAASLSQANHLTCSF